jgi:hypothetical protein
MNKIRPAREFVEDPEASWAQPARPTISLLGQVTDDVRIADNFTLSATRIHTARFKEQAKAGVAPLLHPGDQIRRAESKQDPADEGRYQNSVNKIISFKD